MLTDDQQIRLGLWPKPQVVDMEVITRLPSMSRAIMLCAQLGPFVSDKDVARTLEIDQGVWARIKSGQANFPQDKLEQLMDEAGNEVPLIWFADRRGYYLQRKESALESALREERVQKEELERENKILRSLIQGKV